jgi:hypothetical protein
LWLPPAIHNPVPTGSGSVAWIPESGA